MQISEENVAVCTALGRHQAFAVLENHCGAAQALTLKQIKESDLHQQFGLTWEQFCERYAGITARHADRLIQCQRELGDKYFRLAELARISPALFRQLPPTTDPETIEIDGETFTLLPENAPRIRQALRRLRDNGRETKVDGALARVDYEFGLRRDVMLQEIGKMIDSNLPAPHREFLTRFAKDSVEKWTKIVNRLQALNGKV